MKDSKVIESPTNQPSAEIMSWMLNMEAFPTPQLNEFLAAKLEAISPSVIPNSVEIFMHSEAKQVLVYVGLGFFGRIFRRSSITRRAERVVANLLPSYEHRIITEIHIRNKARERFQQLSEG